MTTLIAIPALPDAAAPGEAHTELPELPALSRLLQQARRLPDSPDWRSGVMRALGMGEATPAAVAVRALQDLPPGSSVCLAAPLHVVAGISRVHLPPGGRLVLDPAEDLQWRDAFNAEFDAAGVRLHAATPAGGWLLVGPGAEGARDPAPELLVGEVLERKPAADAPQRALRRLGTEVEMWLASHPLNRRREAGGQPVVNAIWFWAGTRASGLPRPDALRGIVAGSAPDAWLAGLAVHAGVPMASAENWQAAAPAKTGGNMADAGTLIVPAMPGKEPAAEYWQGLEDRWFAPAAQALAAGEAGALRLQLGGAAWHVPRRSLRHWLRWRRRPWWQAGRPA